MVSQVTTYGLLGLEGHCVLAQTDLSPGLPLFDIVGLADPSVKEARERVRSAIRNSGYRFPTGRIVVNLSPADIRKEGAGYDLPIALGILWSMGQLPPLQSDSGMAFCGELALDGVLRPVPGILSKALAARASGCRILVLPEQNAREAMWVDDLELLPARNLLDVCRHLTGECCLPTCKKEQQPNRILDAPESEGADFSEVLGQEGAKRALEVAAAGGHHLMLSGGPGAGKTMLAKRMAGILPLPDASLALEMARIHSVAGLLDPGGGLLPGRPFRAPHHTISYSGLIGGGRIPRPGEISLSHGGVLFLDELPEFDRASLDALRQPLEDGHVVLARLQATLTYPCRFMLLAAANPCKCGYFGDPGHLCTCPPREAERYHSRISGPLLDRMDMRITVPTLTWKEVEAARSGDTSRVIRERVVRARNLQHQRYSGSPVESNALLPTGGLKHWCVLDAEGTRVMRQAFERFGLTMRGRDRILRVARTIADLEGVDDIRAPHLAEAIRYRQMERAQVHVFPGGRGTEVNVENTVKPIIREGAK